MMQGSSSHHNHSVVATALQTNSPDLDSDFSLSSSLVSDDGLEGTHYADDPLLARSSTASSSEPVFPLVQSIRLQVTRVIDTALSSEQLRSANVRFSITRPMVAKLARGEHPPAALIYALLITRIHFLSSSSTLLGGAINRTRAELCELVALEFLASFSSTRNDSTTGSLDLLHALTLSFNPFAGAEVSMFEAEEGVTELELHQLKKWGKKEASNALELAVLSRATKFTKNALVQSVITAIYMGNVIYQPTGTHALVNDDYKRRRVFVYDPRREPFLDHYRLRVPVVRGVLESITFATIMVLFLLTEYYRKHAYATIWEVLLGLWSLGFCLDEVASLYENGVSAYLLGVYNLLDAGYSLIYLVYLALRIPSLISGDEVAAAWAFDTLSIGAVVLFPRATLSLLRGNVVMLSLSVMIKEFCFFMVLATLTASGFLCSLYILAGGYSGSETKWDLGRISWLLFRIWLGSSYLGFEVASEFNQIYGPILIVAFAVLTQTLLLTILISLLSNTFADVSASAEEEILNQRGLRTLERVKADALSSYSPPMNLVAFFILVPLSRVVQRRWLHKINVAMIKTFNFPTLLVIAIWTRWHYSHSPFASTFGLRSGTNSKRGSRIWESLPHELTGMVWEGTVDGVGKVFEREVDAKAVARFDRDRDSDSGSSSSDEEDQLPPSAQSSAQATQTPTKAVSPRNLEVPPRAKKNGKVRQPSGPDYRRLKSFNPPNPGSTGRHSPLSEVFSLKALIEGGKQEASRPRGGMPGMAARPRKKPSAEANDDEQDSIEQRLARIEDALERIVKEIVRDEPVPVEDD